MKKKTKALKKKTWKKGTPRRARVTLFWWWNLVEPEDTAGSLRGDQMSSRSPPVGSGELLREAGVGGLTFIASDWYFIVLFFFASSDCISEGLNIFIFLHQWGFFLLHNTAWTKIYFALLKCIIENLFCLPDCISRVILLHPSAWKRKSASLTASIEMHLTLSIYILCFAWVHQRRSIHHLGGLTKIVSFFIRIHYRILILVYLNTSKKIYSALPEYINFALFSFIWVHQRRFIFTMLLLPLQKNLFKSEFIQVVVMKRYVDQARDDEDLKEVVEGAVELSACEYIRLSIKTKQKSLIKRRNGIGGRTEP